MANIHVKQRLERIANDLAQVRTHIVTYSGVDKRDAYLIDKEATDIALVATQIAAEARAASGDRSASSLLKKVRRALGFTYP